MLMDFVGVELALGTARMACPCSLMSGASAGTIQRLGGVGGNWMAGGWNHLEASSLTVWQLTPVFSQDLSWG